MTLFVTHRRHSFLYLTINLVHGIYTSCKITWLHAARHKQHDAQVSNKYPNFPFPSRNVFGTPAKRELLNYDNVRPSTNAHDSDLIKANPQFISLNWQASGGGSFAVIPVSQVGKQQDALPLYNGFSGPVLDTDFN